MLVRKRWQRSNFTFLKIGSPLFPSTFIEEASLSLIFIFGAFVKNQLAAAVVAHAFNSSARDGVGWGGGRDRQILQF